MLRDLARAFAGEIQLTERQGSILLAVSGVVFSITAISYRAVESATEWQFLAYRGGSTALAMVLLIWARRGGRPVRLRGTTPRTVFAGIVLASSSMFYILALSRTSAATTLFLLASAPVFAAIIARVALHEQVARATLIAIGFTGVGIAVMVGTGIEAGSTTGVVLALCIPVTIAVFNVVLRSDSTSDPVVPALIAGITLGSVAAVVALAQTGLSVSLRDGLLACLTGGVALGIGLPLFNLGHRSVAAAKVSLLLMTEIVLAPLWVWIWPGETPSLGTLAGGAIVLATVAWLVTRSSGSAVAADTPTIPH